MALSMTISEFLNAFNKLKLQQSQLEKNELDLLKYLSKHVDSNFEEEYNEIKILREQEFHDIQNEVKDAIYVLKNIKQLIAKENVEDTDTCMLKDNMMSFQIRLYSVKVRLQKVLEDLQENEHILQDDVGFTQEKLAEMRKQVTRVKKICSQATQNEQKHTPFFQEVKDFANYVNKYGGHVGGWPEEDHATFLKIFKKNSDAEKVIKAVRRVMPDISEEKVQQHLDWYNKYIFLRAKQKQALEEWKQSKVRKKIKPQEEENPSRNSNNKSHSQSVEVQQMKEKLHEWKMQKQLKCEKTLEVASREIFRKKKLEQEQKEIRKKVRKEIRKWREALDANQRNEQMQKDILWLRERERRAVLANKLIKEFQHQDQQLLRRRLANKQASDNQKCERLEKKSVRVARDPARLLKPTKQWEARVARDDQNDVPNFFTGHPFVKEIQKLGIPEWRKTVS